MKNIFLILGTICCICMSDAYAAMDSRYAPVPQNTETQKCYAGCKQIGNDDGTGERHPVCGQPDGYICCVAKDQNGVVYRCGVEITETRYEAPRYKQQKARSAKMMVPQKVVYKEIYFDDSVDEIEE